MKRFECKKQDLEIDTEVNWKPMETQVSVCSSVRPADLHRAADKQPWCDSSAWSPVKATFTCYSCKGSKVRRQQMSRCGSVSLNILVI